MIKLLFYIYDKAPQNKELAQLAQEFKIVIFTPSMFRLKKHYSNLLIYIFWFLFTKRKYKIVYVINKKNEIIHYSHILPKLFKFPFMQSNDLEIGPCWTSKEYRGRGIYPFILKYIVEKLSQDNRRFWIFAHEDNNPSIKGIRKSGFRFVGKGTKSKVFGIYSKFGGQVSTFDIGE